MNRRLLLLAAASLFVLAPAVQHQIYGVESSSSTVVKHENVVNDENINVAVKKAIASDIELAKYINNIHISVDKGVVTLSGVVDSSKAKSNIESKAKAVMGVKKVVNNIEVKEVKSS